MVENQRLEQVGLAAVFVVSRRLEQALHVGPNTSINSFCFAGGHAVFRDFCNALYVTQPSELRQSPPRPEGARHCAPRAKGHIIGCLRMWRAPLC